MSDQNKPSQMDQLRDIADQTALLLEQLVTSEIKGLEIRLKDLSLQSDTDGERIQMFARGDWESGVRYERGDVVSIPQLGLFICLASTVADPRLSSDDWTVLSVTSGGVGSAGGGGGGIPVAAPHAFTTHIDVPNTYAGAANMYVRVNAAQTGLIFDDAFATVPVANLPPAAPQNGDLWFFANTGNLMIFDAGVGAWIGV
jgi:hypothetical protein